MRTLALQCKPKQRHALPTLSINQETMSGELLEVLGIVFTILVGICYLLALCTDDGQTRDFLIWDAVLDDPVAAYALSSSGYKW